MVKSRHSNQDVLKLWCCTSLKVNDKCVNVNVRQQGTQDTGRTQSRRFSGIIPIPPHRRGGLHGKNKNQIKSTKQIIKRVLKPESKSVH